MAKDQFGYGTEGKPNWNDLGRDNKLDVQMELGNAILETLPASIARQLDNTDQPYEMARTLLENSNGDIDKASKLLMETNQSYMKKGYKETDGVGDYWDYWTNNLPDIYKRK